MRTNIIRVALVCILAVCTYFAAIHWQLPKEQALALAAALCLAFCACFAVRFYLDAKKKQLLHQEQKLVDRSLQELKFADIISYYKEPAVQETMRGNKDFLPVVIKQRVENAFFVSLTIYDQKEKKTVKVCTVKADSLDELTLKQFGGKDMLVVS